MDRKKYEELRQKWFAGLEAIARRYPDLFPVGILSGVVLNVMPVQQNGAPTNLLEVRPGISPSMPAEVAQAVQELFRELFRR